ncbi:hypothetical protein F5876DRAFT_70678 [Lentinula aff. lateritia]|uniref:Uncharacterized protein n=1 Tax=Lentinula aff. lateritia TaxID=2804960 RepID=A0ACC1THY8_9AGAR|nr:hypothetical protein F5876DRAFT_70678 [Lentinula aff. lateritia]
MTTPCNTETTTPAIRRTLRAVTQVRSYYQGQYDELYDDENSMPGNSDLGIHGRDDASSNVHHDTSAHKYDNVPTISWPMLRTTCDSSHISMCGLSPDHDTRRFSGWGYGSVHVGNYDGYSTLDGVDFSSNGYSGLSAHDHGYNGNGFSGYSYNFSGRGRGNVFSQGRGRGESFGQGRGHSEFSPRGRGGFSMRGRGEFSTRSQGEFSGHSHSEFSDRGRGSGHNKFSSHVHVVVKASPLLKVAVGSLLMMSSVPAAMMAKIFSIVMALPSMRNYLFVVGTFAMVPPEAKNHLANMGWDLPYLQNAIVMQKDLSPLPNMLHAVNSLRRSFFNPLDLPPLAIISLSLKGMAIVPYSTALLQLQGFYSATDVPLISRSLKFDLGNTSNYEKYLAAIKRLLLDIKTSRVQHVIVFFTTHSTPDAHLHFSPGGEVNGACNETGEVICMISNLKLLQDGALSSFSALSFNGKPSGAMMLRLPLGYGSLRQCAQLVVFYANEKLFTIPVIHSSQFIVNLMSNPHLMALGVVLFRKLFLCLIQCERFPYMGVTLVLRRVHLHQMGHARASLHPNPLSSDQRLQSESVSKLPRREIVYDLDKCLEIYREARVGGDNSDSEVLVKSKMAGLGLASTKREGWEFQEIILNVRDIYADIWVKQWAPK